MYNLDIIEDDDKKTYETESYIECYFLSGSQGYTKTNPRPCRHIFVLDSKRIVHVQISSPHLLEKCDKLIFGDSIRLVGFNKFGNNKDD